MFPRNWPINYESSENFASTNLNLMPTQRERKNTVLYNYKDVMFWFYKSDINIINLEKKNSSLTILLRPPVTWFPYFPVTNRDIAGIPDIHSDILLETTLVIDRVALDFGSFTKVNISFDSLSFLQDVIDTSEIFQYFLCFVVSEFK